MRWIFFIVILFGTFSAHAVCDPGYYLWNDECVRCPRGYYCPNENSVIECPVDTTDWYQLYTDRGYDILDTDHAQYWTISTGDTIRHCATGISLHTTKGSFYIEPKYNGNTYDPDYTPLWYHAHNGYYLSRFRWINGPNTWYGEVKPCTNAPEHAHYTGPGTPDEPMSGGATDYNDCPWECDTNFGNHNGECVPLCTAGARYIRTNTGLRFNLYPISYSSPQLAIEHRGTICYGILAPGHEKNTINLELSGKIYHVKN